jgi:hypothetical protein
MRPCFPTALLLSLLATLPLAAQGLSDGIPANVPLHDTARAVTLPRIDAAPAGSHGFVRTTPDGRFQFNDGTPARFVGVTLEWSACLPDSAQAIRIAARLAKLGVNLVRMRYFENSYWWGGASSILDVATGAQALNPETMGRFDWFVHQLRAHGIYSYLTLQAARAPVAQDGLGELADSALWLGTGLYHLYPEGRAALKHHSRLILDHVNPFTGRAYRDEPAIAMIELMDRGSFLSMWRQGLTSHVNGGYTLSFDHSRRLDTLFSRYLAGRYGSQSGLAAAWRETPPPGGYPNVVREGSFEGDFEQHWEAFAYDGPTVTTILTQNDSVPDGQYALTLRLRNTDGTLTKAYLRQAVPLEYNRLYRLRFRAKASNPTGRPVYVIGVESAEAGAYAGLQATVQVNSYWSEHEVTFLTPAVMRAPVSVYLFFGDTDGDLSLDDVKITAVEPAGLLAGESLATSTVARIPPSTNASLLVASQRLEDQSEFMMGLDRGLFGELRSYVRDSIGAPQPITGAGHSWASNLMEASVQRSMDFSTANVNWDWIESITDGMRVRNYSQLRQTWAGSIHDLSSFAHDRQPLVAAFAQPNANRFLAESMTLLPAYALHQEWDAIIFDVWSDDRFFDTLDIVGSSDYYELAKNPVANAMLPAVSQIFRNALVAPASSTIRLQHTREQIAQIPRFYWAWGRHAVPAYIPGWAMAVNRIVHDSLDASEFTQTGDISFPPTLDEEASSDTREIRWEHNQGVLSINTPRLQAATGHISRSGGVSLDQLDIEVLSGNETATVIWTTTDSLRTLEDAGRSLLVVTSRTEPTGLAWSDTANLTGWGTSPMVIEPVRARLTFSLAAPAQRLLVRALDSSGLPTGDTIAIASDGSIMIDQSRTKSQWYEVIVDRGSGITGAELADAVRVIRSNGDRLLLEINATRADDARIELYDAVGRLVRSDARTLVAGAQRHSIDATGLASGAYSCIVRTSSGATVARVIIAR